MVVGDQRPGDRGAGLVVVPDRGGHGQDALGDADGDSLEGAAAVGFQVELAFEGVVDRFDELADGLEQRLAVPGGLVLAGGPQQCVPLAARSAWVWRPAKPLSVIRIRPGRLAASWGSTSSMAVSTSRSPILGSARAHRTGIPAGVQIRYSRSPQNQREWLAQ
jgi:hypothetical protein